jgi:dihydrofolate reductase
MKIVVTEFISLDGVIEDPGGSEGTVHGGWHFEYSSEPSGRYKFDELQATDGLLLGRVTYQGFADAWPDMQDESGFADRMNSLPKYVVTSTLTEAAWNATTIIDGRNMAAEVSRLREQPGGDLVVHGSCQLVGGLADAGLIDELRLMVHPVVLGQGKRLFDGAAGKLPLRLTDTQQLPNGVVTLAYAPASAD